MNKQSSLTVAKIVIVPFTCNKVISFLIPYLWIWSTKSSIGFPAIGDLKNTFYHWDAIHYINIAVNGYPSHATPDNYHLYAFFPGYPFLIRLTMIFFGDAITSGLVVSAIAEFGALYFVTLLVSNERDQESAKFAVWILAMWPLGFFLTTVYTESTFIALAAASLYFMRKGRLGIGSVLAMLSCTVRLTGLALIFPLLIEVYRYKKWKPNRYWISVLLIPLPVALFMVYLHHLSGSWSEYPYVQSHKFNHAVSWPWDGFFTTFGSVSRYVVGTNSFVFSLEVFFAISGGIVCGIAWVYRKFPVSLAAYCTAVWLSSVCLTFWLSVPRYEMAMFPALLLLADFIEKRPSLRTGLIAVCASLMSFGAVLFASGQWLG